MREEIIRTVKKSLEGKFNNWFEHGPKRIYFSIDREDIVEVSRILFKDLGLRFAIATGIDTKDAFEILYHFSHDKTGIMFSVRVFIQDKKNPEIESISHITKAAEWIEREIWEMLGINFKNHPNLKRLLLSEDWPEGKYPLRKK